MRILYDLSNEFKFFEKAKELYFHLQRFQMWRKLVNDAGCRKVCHKFPMEYTLEMIKEKVELIG